MRRAVTPTLARGNVLGVHPLQQGVKEGGEDTPRMHGAANFEGARGGGVPSAICTERGKENHSIYRTPGDDRRKNLYKQERGERNEREPGLINPNPQRTSGRDQERKREDNFWKARPPQNITVHERGVCIEIS